MEQYRLRSLRLQDAKKQRDLADYLKISRQYYSEYELGKRKMPAEAIIKIAKYYNTTTDFVLGLSDKRSSVKYD